MFGSGRIKALEARLDQLEADLDQRVAAAREQLRAELRDEICRALARVEADPSKRLALLVEAVEGALGQRLAALEPALDRAQAVVDRASAHAPGRRDTPILGMPITATETGLLTLWQDFGYNDTVELRIVIDGDEQVVGCLNSGRGLSNSLAMLIRAGETYILDSESDRERGETGVRTCFTPLG